LQKKGYSLQLSPAAMAHLSPENLKRLMYQQMDLPKADLETALAASKQAKLENHARLEDAGNKIIGWNDYTMIQDAIWDMGKEIAYSNDDYCINYYVEAPDKNAYDRQMTNRQIENIFGENNIDIPSGEELTFTVDPYDYRITVSGTSDNALREKIESVLNQGDNGKGLYTHIHYSAKNHNSSQIDNSVEGKRMVFGRVLSWTGADLRECTRVGNDFVTADGKSVKAMLRSYIESTEWDYKEDRIAHYSNQMMQYDYNDGHDQVLSIKYTNTGLHDIGQDVGYGTGQTDWVYDVQAEMEEKLGKKVLTTFL